MSDTLTKTSPETATETATDQRQSSDPSRVIPTRRVSFAELLEDLPKYYAADGDLIHSHIMASLSAVFPDGEDFFVRSVRHYRDQITDPALKRQVNGFIGQEAMHGREHRVFNDRLAELGYPTKRLEAFTKKGLAKRERLLPPISNLASTAALEHFTATLAEELLSNPAARATFGHEGVKHLLLWHALEESEHKAVAFDVYKAVGGSERVRVLTMKSTRIAFVIGLTFQVLVAMAMDPTTRQPGVLRNSVKRFRKSPLMSKELWQRLKDYDRPDFHPDDHDTSALEAEWRERLFATEGTLTKP